MILGMNRHRPLCGRAHRGRDLRHDVRRPGVGERVRRVEPQPIEPVLRDPRHRVVDDEAPHGVRARPIQVDAAAPRRAVVHGQVLRIELHQVRALGPEVVVDDVEDDGDVEPVSGIDEGAQIVGPAVVSRRRVEADAVVAPVAGAGELRDRHQLDGRDAEIVQLAEPLPRGRERAFPSEGADVQLVERELAWRPRGPPLMLPAVGVQDRRFRTVRERRPAGSATRDRGAGRSRRSNRRSDRRRTRPGRSRTACRLTAGRGGRCRPRRRSAAAAAAGARAAPARGSGPLPARAARRSACPARCRP